MKELSKTKSTVRLRKVEDRKEWYLYIESYPVYAAGKKQPQRVREYLNRTVSTVEWGKKRTARTEADGSKTYKPKRDDNGLILCRSEKDRETILYADGVRKLRQREYDNADLYSDTETAQAVKDWKSKQPAKVLVIGHDPRLQQSNTIADYALFADYYFQSEPKNSSEKRKFGLAKSTFEQIMDITNGKIKPEEIYLTNLCNEALPHAPKGKTVLIPENKANAGIEHITQILKDNPSIEYVFSMSLQVNYWLQKLEFCDSNFEFVQNSKPKEKGINNIEPYYEATKPRTFLLVCGNQYKVTNGNQIVIPILHSKNYPIKGNFCAYLSNYEKVRKFFAIKSC
jgi:hypothetical protein